jgi:O-antigen/teichoic acid export membrane protein
MAPVSDAAAVASREATDATRGSAIKLGAEVSSRLLGLATTFLLLRGLGASDFGRFGELSVYALFLAELGELGLQNLASRVLVAGSLSLPALVRARVWLLAGVACVGLLVLAFNPTLALLLAWFVLSGWGEFLGVALRCRGARVAEAVLLVVLRGGGLVGAALALLLGRGLVGVAALLAVSPLPALALGGAVLGRTPAPPAPFASVRSVLGASLPLAVHGGLLLLSPRVEFLVLTFARGAEEVGLFLAAVNVYWFLGMVPSAVAAGAMPALTREAVRGEGPVRRRTAATLALLAAPAAVGLALVSFPLSRLLLGAGYPPRTYAGTAWPLALLALGVPALFLNWIRSAALIASGRMGWLPRLTATRVAAALAMAVVLVPRLGGVGAACSVATAEWLLLLLAGRACRAVGFPVPVARPLTIALAATVPMGLAVSGAPGGLAGAVAVGALTWAATLAAAWRLRPDLLSGLLGDGRLP